MSESKILIYDVDIDLMRPVTQADVDSLTAWSARFGMLVRGIRLDAETNHTLGPHAALVMAECEKIWAAYRQKELA